MSLNIKSMGNYFGFPVPQADLLCLIVFCSCLVVVHYLW